MNLKEQKISQMPLLSCPYLGCRVGTFVPIQIADGSYVDYRCPSCQMIGTPIRLEGIPQHEPRPYV